MSGCNVTINRGDKGTKYVTVLGTDDHEVARELALKEMGWTQAECAAVTVNPKSEDEPNHPTTIEAPLPPVPVGEAEVTIEVDTESLKEHIDEKVKEITEAAEPQFQESEGVESVPASRVDEPTTAGSDDRSVEETTAVVDVSADNPGETLNLSASDADPNAETNGSESPDKEQDSD